MNVDCGTSGLLVKVLACNRKVAGSSPTRVRLFPPMSVLSSTLKNEEVFITASFGGDVKPLVPGSWLILATCAILASSLSHIWSKTLVEKKKKKVCVHSAALMDTDATTTL